MLFLKKYNTIVPYITIEIVCLFLLISEAAEVLVQNRRLFEQNVAKSMRGGYVGSVYFAKMSQVI